MLSIIIKAVLAVAGILGLLFIAGITGFLFFIWPTSFGDHHLNVTPQVLSELRLFQHEKKFVEDSSNHYPGAPNEAIRVNAQVSVDNLIQTLITELPSSPRRSFVLSAMKRTMSSFTNQDTEEQEQLLRYCERILATLGVDSSGELFNVWRYGFPYGWLLHS